MALRFTYAVPTRLERKPGSVRRASGHSALANPQLGFGGHSGLPDRTTMLGFVLRQMLDGYLRSRLLIAGLNQGPERLHRVAAQHIEERSGGNPSIGSLVSGAFISAPHPEDSPPTINLPAMPLPSAFPWKVQKNTYSPGSV